MIRFSSRYMPLHDWEKSMIRFSSPTCLRVSPLLHAVTCRTGIRVPPSLHAVTCRYMSDGHPRFKPPRCRPTTQLALVDQEGEARLSPSVPTCRQRTTGGRWHAHSGRAVAPFVRPSEGHAGHGEHGPSPDPPGLPAGLALRVGVRHRPGDPAHPGAPAAWNEGTGGGMWARQVACGRGRCHMGTVGAMWARVVGWAVEMNCDLK